MADPALQSRRGVLAALGAAYPGAIAGNDPDSAGAKGKTRYQTKRERWKDIKPTELLPHVDRGLNIDRDEAVRYAGLTSEF